jgi:hypothetical protein
VDKLLRILRLLLLFEAATFVVAAVIHFGGLLDGYEHYKAGTAESVLAVVLLAGLALTSRSAWARQAVVGAQAFAILGVFVGLFTIAVGVGPRTALDIGYHVGILIVLLVGVAIALRGPELTAPSAAA